MAKNPGTPRVEYEELGALKRWPKNPKGHSMEFLGEAFKENGFAELPIVDEGTGRMVAGHGRLDKLEAMHKAGESPPERVQVRGGKWFVPVIRGMTFRKPAKHLLASNRGSNDMTTAEITAKAKHLAESGIDARTITVDFEVRLNRKLEPAEAQALQDGWRAAAPKRHERYRRSQQDAADARRNT